MYIQAAATLLAACSSMDDQVLYVLHCCSSANEAHQCCHPCRCYEASHVCKQGDYLAPDSCVWDTVVDVLHETTSVACSATFVPGSGS